MRRLSFRILAIISLLGLGLALFSIRRPQPIKVGILHAQTGTMAISEISVLQATLLAIDEINARGGVLGRPLEALVVDTRSDWTFAAQEAERLIQSEQVVTIFGCWTSACRKTLKPVVERTNHLLMYPLQYEGGETSPNIIYLGAAPNQQIIPAVTWSLARLGPRVMLVGSDYIFPHIANAIIREQVQALGGEIVGEQYVLLGSTEVQPLVNQIAETRPDVILNTINGDTNRAFFTELRARGITADQVPTVSFSLAEPEVQQLGISLVAGDYAAWNYFQSLPTPENQAFVARYRARYGAQSVISDPMEAAYIGVYLWAQAVDEAQSPTPGDIRTALLRQSLLAPEGIVSIDAATQHLWKPVRIGQIATDGQFQIVWDSQNAVRPEPYPFGRPPASWHSVIADYQSRWRGQWANPGN